MEYVIASFLIFYLFMLITTFVSKRDMRWSELRKKYSCSNIEIKSLDKDERIFYAINGNWTNTNLISIHKDNKYLYMWGSELSCGWIFQPIKIPLSDMQYTNNRLCFFKQREVYEITLSNTALQYAATK